MKKIVKFLPLLIACLAAANMYLRSSLEDENKQKAEVKSVKVEEAQVLRAVDGDTLQVKIADVEEKIRLIGVNTPESVDPRRPVECFGKEASTYTKKLADGQKVRLENDPSQGDKDKYGRLLRYVYLSDESLLNLRIIKDGYGYEYTYDLPYAHQAEFRQAMQEARQAKKGLWADETCGLKNVKHLR